VCTSIEFTSLRDASVDIGICIIWKQFCAQIAEDWGYKVCALVLVYDQNVCIDSILNSLQNMLLNSVQAFRCPTSVECQELHCKVEYTNSNQGIFPQYHYFWVQYTESELNNAFQGWVSSFSLIHIGWTPPIQILQFLLHLTTGEWISTYPMRCNKTQQLT